MCNPASVIFFLLVSLSQLSMAQTADEKLTATILQKDSLFWVAYNTCETASYGQFLTDDVEFYHDKGGVTVGLESLVSTTKKNLCSPGGIRLRREAVEGTVKVFPMKKSDTIYGAIISGEHVFYVLEKGKPERLDGQAKFMQLWLLKDGAWKMARILSYDHAPAKYINKRKEIAVSSALLEQYAKTYKGPQTGIVNVLQHNGRLVLQAGDNKMNLYPETETVFFSKERDLTFEFTRDSNNRVSKMIVRERGVIVEETIVQTGK